MKTTTQRNRKAAHARNQRRKLSLRLAPMQKRNRQDRNRIERYGSLEAYKNAQKLRRAQRRRRTRGLDTSKVLRKLEAIPFGLHQKPITRGAA